MSFRYPAGLITASSPVNANYPSGVWTPRQALPYLQNNVWGQDPFFDQTVLLLHGDGTNGAQNNTFLDSSSNNFTITRNGNTTQGTFTPFSASSGYWSSFYNTGSYMWFNNATNLQPGTSAFTLEMWLYYSSSTTNFPILYRAATSFPTYGYILEVSNDLIRFITDDSTNGQSTLGDIAATTILKNQWFHLAIVREGLGSNQAKMYINGSLVSTGTMPQNLNDSSQLRIATNGAINSFYNGYISNLRFVKGTAVYTSAFTPSTIPLTAITNTQLLTLQDNRRKDNSANDFAVAVTSGTIAQQAFSPFQPFLAYSPGVTGGSGYFDGTGDYLTVANNAAFDFGSGDFTIEVFVYTTSTANQSFYTRLTTTGIGTSVSLVSSKWYGSVSINGTSAIAISSTDNAVPNSWNHVALTRSGTTLTLWVNGVSAGTNTVSGALHNPSTTSYIGAAFPNTIVQPVIGYISDLRIIKGTAVYTSAFTPPTAPLTAIANTSILLNFTNAGILDNTAKNVLETVGNAQIDTAVVKYGTGSMEFDGSGDYLSFISTPDTTLGTGNLTIEGWFNSNSISTLQTIIERRAALTARGIAIFIETSVLKLRAGDTSTGAWEVNIDSGTLSSSTWYYFALTRSGNTWRGFLNGTQIGSDVTWSGTVVDETSAWLIGAAFGGGAGMNGYIDDLRITKGIARYTANFVPPVARFPNQ